MLVARYTAYQLKFKIPAGTSRGVLREKLSYFIALHDSDAPEAIGLGECGILQGLSADDRPGYLEKLEWLCQNINKNPEELDQALVEFPSIRFGLEMALADLKNGGEQQFFDTPFAHGNAPIAINGLIWMGSPEDMARQVESKVNAGFQCIKLKIGALDFEEEFKLLRRIRKDFHSSDLEIRVDANGAFSPGDAYEKLDKLASLNIHSIEQPIAAGQLDEMAALCAKTPLPIALDEDLIGIFDPLEQKYLLEKIKPQFIVLKPSFLGGWKASKQWIDLATTAGAGWWITSALESSVGLNAIAQWTAHLKTTMAQGLGTGQLYTNNFPSPLTISQGQLRHYGSSWDLDALWEQEWEAFY